ncbi:hypothetical protein ABT075_24240 [Streptomyces sp. NPDC002677]|uniref:hypothetical protein n=1 Tax=Streptomyces sp. NPDC002677 TaxID=3154774 RepID=UPI00332CE461
MVSEGWDLRPGREPGTDATSEEVPLAYLYARKPIAYACAGLRLTDARAVVGAPDRWVQLPERDDWEKCAKDTNAPPAKLTSQWQISQ